MSEKPEESSFDKFEEEMGITPLDEDALQMYELYISLKRSGFREKQALQLVAMIVNDAEMFYSVDTDVDEDDSEEPSG